MINALTLACCHIWGSREHSLPTRRLRLLNSIQHFSIRNRFTPTQRNSMRCCRTTIVASKLLRKTHHRARNYTSQSHHFRTHQYFEWCNSRVGCTGHHMKSATNPGFIEISARLEYEHQWAPITPYVSQWWGILWFHYSRWSFYYIHWTYESKCPSLWTSAVLTKNELRSYVWRQFLVASGWKHWFPHYSVEHIPAHLQWASSRIYNNGEYPYHMRNKLCRTKTWRSIQYSKNKFLSINDHTAQFKT